MGYFLMLAMVEPHYIDLSQEINNSSSKTCFKNCAMLPYQAGLTVKQDCSMAWFQTSNLIQLNL